MTENTRRRRGWSGVWGGLALWAVLAGGLTVTTVLWRTGALAGTYEANLLSRAATVLRTSDITGIPELAAPPGPGSNPDAEYLQAWDPADRTVTFRSPSLAGRDLPYPEAMPRGLRDRLSLASLPTGERALRVVTPLADRDGRTRMAVYLAPARPFDLERARLGAIAGAFWFGLTGLFGGLTLLRRR